MTTMTPIEIDLFRLGYVRSPNNIHGLPGSIWYPGMGGLPCVPDSHEVQVLSDRIRIFTIKFRGEPYSPKSYWDTVTVEIFVSTHLFINWCREHGTVSKSGLPAYANSHN